MYMFLKNSNARKAGTVPLIFHYRIAEEKNKLTSLMSLIAGVCASAKLAAVRLPETEKKKDLSQMRQLFEEMKWRLPCLQNQRLNKT
ncbi:MAG: hypothetical protein VX350_05520 [Pseudomonadota bacterium]|nr:hypothetical protein [Pseudomonadota bacterium]